MTYKQIIVGTLETNCYILISGNKGIIIDPGAEPDKIIEAIDGIEVKLILATHRHFDHIDALQHIKNMTHARAAIHKDDWVDGFDYELKDGQIINTIDIGILVLHTPGHTPGSCCFLTENKLFAGDTLFPGGHGNTSFPGGDEQTIFKSIKEKLMKLPDGTLVLPGHGQSTTIGQERSLY